MAELDADLSVRLSKLAAAVPVAPAELDLVHREAVRARQQVRMAWVTPLVVLVVGVIAASVLQIGPFAPQPSDPITATTIDGDFTLSIEASRATYFEEEPIAIWASLAYDGGASTAISHAPVAGGSPIGFGINEPIFGEGRLDPYVGSECSDTTIERDQPLTVPFEKTVSPLFDAATSDIALFLEDPELRLPAGVWHIYASARFTIGDCGGLQPRGGDTHLDMRVQLEVTVLPRPGDTARSSDAHAPEPTTPRPTPEPTRSPENAGLENAAMSDSGDYWIEIHSDRRIYRASDPITVTGTFKYLGDAPIDVQEFHPLVFSVAEPVHGIRLDGGVTLECGHDRLLPGQQIDAPFHKAGGISTLDPTFEFKKAYLDDPALKLPPGSWHIQVSGWLVEGECGMPVERFSTEIEITVLADSAERMDLLTESDPLAVAQCRDRFTTGGLARDEGTGLGIEMQPGTVQRVLWPYGYSAWDTPEGAILVDGAGRTVGHEGQRVVVDGLDEPGWLIRAGCIRFIVLTDVLAP